jgi:RNA polymerase I-specific transcription initiation factor RRN5
MLDLSKTVFMNRSPTIPSPWPHWSEYASEFAQEPSIYRSAFNDLHTLVVSVTKRLVQTALVQATSRLRSQRHRVKGGIPLVKKRDVLTAIDIVGMQRNSQERWSRVARRCALRVYEAKWSRSRRDRTRREVPWDEVEQTLAPVEPPLEPQTTDAETSGNDIPNFSVRAKRSGTPLPIDRLALSDSDDESRVNESEPPSRSASQSRDTANQLTNPPLVVVPEKPGSRRLTLGEFDRETSRKEEQVLWDMLGLEPIIKTGEAEIGGESDDVGLDEDDKVTTLPEGWRSWTSWRTEWEEYGTPPPETAFLANQKPLDVPPILQGHSSDTVESSFDDDTDTPAQQFKHRSKPSIQQTVELHTRSTSAYAALQGRSSEPVRSPSQSSSQDEATSDNDVQDHRLPRPPIENTRTKLSTSASSNTPIDSSDSESNQPTQSIERDNKPAPSIASSEVSTDMEMDEPVRSVEPRSNRALAVDSDDEPKEMDWESFIHE